MMNKEEIIKMFNDLEADIKLLQQMLGLKDKILQLAEEGNEEEQDKFLEEEWDTLENQLKVIELM